MSLVDADRQKAGKLAQRFNVENIYSDVGLMLSEQKPDIVHILTPPQTHAELAIQAIRSGSHVIIEKPMALSLKEADAIVAAADENGVKVGVDHNNLWEPLMMKARRLVQGGQAGKILHVDVTYCFDRNRLQDHGGSGAKLKWLMRLPGGPLFDLVPQALAIVLHFLEEPVKVSAIAKRNGLLPLGLPDELRVLVDSSSCTGAMCISLGIEPDFYSVNIYGSKMSIQVNLSNLTLITRKQRPIPRKIFRAVDNIGQGLQHLYGTFANGYKVVVGKMPSPDDVGAVVGAFYQSIESRTTPPVTGDQGRAVVRVTEEILKQVV